MYVLSHSQALELNTLLSNLLAIETLNADERSMLANTHEAGQQLARFNGMLSMSLTPRRFQWIRDIAKRNGEKAPFLQVAKAEKNVKEMGQAIDTLRQQVEALAKSASV